MFNTPTLVNPDLAVLPSAMRLLGQQETVYPAVILDSQRGPVMVDCGDPGLLEHFQASLATIHCTLESVRTILITHHDLDHIGCLPDIVKASGAEVWASPPEVPYLGGQQEQKVAALGDPEAFLAKFPPERRALLSELFMHRQPPVPVTRELRDGEVLDIAGGVRVIFTPGHTVGHTSYYLERTQVLLAGDALRVENGQLLPPFPAATADMPTALASLQKLVDLPVQAIHCFHGGLLKGNAAAQLRQVADSVC